MINSRTYLACFLFFFALYRSLGQPVLDFSVTPEIGNQMEYVANSPISFTDPGTAGTNQIWDLPYFPSSTPNLNQSCIAVAGTPFAAQYPGAQYCVKTLFSPLSPTRFAYFAKTDSSMRFLGQSFLGNVVYKNMPSWDQTLPMQYGDVQVGQFNGTLQVGAQTTFSRTHFRNQYDGYGALFFGFWKEYDTAMRVQTILTRIDSLPSANGSHRRTVVEEESYKWYAQGVPSHVAFISTVNSTQMTISANGDTTQIQAFPTQYQIERQSDFTVATTTPDGPSNFAIMPNPSSGQFVVQWPDVNTLDLRCYDVLGNLIWQNEVSGGNVRLDMGQYPSGLYQLIGVSEGRRYLGKVVVER